MKNFLSTAWYLALALPLMLLDAVFGVALMSLRLWERCLRTARELGEPPPAGGMYGTMARRLREKAHSSDQPNR